MSWDADASAALASLDRDARIGQLNQRLKGWQCIRRIAGQWHVSDLLRAEVDRWGGIGAIYGLFRADAWSGVGISEAVPRAQRAEVAALVCDYVRSQSQGAIPPLLVEEAPHGHMAVGGTLAPVNLALAAGLDTGSVREMARFTGLELAESGCHLALVSGLDLARDPRWGRSEECFGEDPDLAATMVSAVVSGMQSVAGIGVVLKHFAAQGVGLGGRNAASAPIGPVELSEIHLPPAHAGIEAGAMGVMAAYNDIDGTPCIAHRGLLTSILRERWGFDGIVMADGGAIDRLMAHLPSGAHAAAAALHAGVDLSLWDRSYGVLDEALVRGLATPEDLDRAAFRVLRVKARLGLLAPAAERPDVPSVASVRAGAASLGTRMAASSTVRAEHARSLQRVLAERSVVLLSNRDDTLPLRSGQRVVLVGPGCRDGDALLGDYTPPHHDGEVITIADELCRRRGGLVTAVVPGGTHATIDPDGVAAAAAAANEADATVIVLGDTSARPSTTLFAENGAARVDGDHTMTAGEGVDTSDVRLPSAQRKLVAAIARASRRMIAVVIAGRAHVLTDVLRLADAVLFVPYPGPAGAVAIADVLEGVVNPSGRLPVTLPGAPGALPVAHDQRIESAVGYADTGAPVSVLFATGGSYTSWELSEPRLSRTTVGVPELLAGAVVELCFTVRNSGRLPGRIVVPVLGRRASGARSPRASALLAHVVTELDPGRSADLRCALGARHLWPKTDDGAPEPTAGNATIWLAGPVSETPSVCLQVRG